MSSKVDSPLGPAPRSSGLRSGRSERPPAAECSPLPPPVVMTMILFRAAVDFRRVGMARSDNFSLWEKKKGKGRKMKDFQFFYIIFFVVQSIV